MADRSYTFLKGFFKADVDLALLVLNPEDWNKRQPTIPYGTPYADLAVLSTDAPQSELKLSKLPTHPH
jgi:hypothetical protein